MRGTGTQNSLGYSVSKEPCVSLRNQGAWHQSLGPRWASTASILPALVPTNSASWQGPGLKCPFHRSENKEPLSTWIRLGTNSQMQQQRDRMVFQVQSNWGESGNGVNQPLLHSTEPEISLHQQLKKKKKIPQVRRYLTGEQSPGEGLSPGDASQENSRGKALEDRIFSRGHWVVATKVTRRQKQLGSHLSVRSLQPVVITTAPLSCICRRSGHWWEAVYSRGNRRKPVGPCITLASLASNQSPLRYWLLVNMHPSRRFPRALPGGRSDTRQGLPAPPSRGFVTQELLLPAHTNPAFRNHSIFREGKEGTLRGPPAETPPFSRSKGPNK